MRRVHFFCGVSVTILAFCLSPAAAQPVVPELGEVITVTDSDLDSRLARSPQGSLVFDRDGVLHLVYTEQNAEGTGLGNPGEMLYTTYTTEGFAAQLAIRSDAGEGGVPFQSGGNPSMAVQDDGRVHLIWHDYRHSTSDSGTNQVEVYYRQLLPSGSFASDEIRLSDNSGNSWRPKIRLLPDNRVVAAWYDYSNNSLGDLLVTVSDADHNFPDAIDFASQVVPEASPNGEGVLTAQMAADSQGGLHFVWTTAELSGFFFVNEGLVYGTIDSADERILSQRQVIDARATSSTDPAKIVVDEQDTVWVAWTSYSNDIPNIHLAAKAGGADSFDEPIALTENDLPDMVEQPNLAIGPDGTVYVVWVDYRTGEGDLYLRAYDPTNDSLSEAIQLTDSLAVDEKPGIAIDENGRIAIVWERAVDGRVNLAMRLTEADTSVASWMLFE